MPSLSSPEASVSCEMKSTYPFPAIRVRRIVRDSGKSIGDFQLTAEAAQGLSDNALGVLIGNCGSADAMQEKLLTLAETEYPASWVVVLSSLDLARKWYAHQHGTVTSRLAANSPAERFWKTGNCWFTRPEQLEPLLNNPDFSAPVAGILVADPLFRMPHARGHNGARWKYTDRPELITRFRVEATAADLQPPLILLANQPAKSLNSKPAERGYCLDGLWYCDGSRLRVGQPPEIVDDSTSGET